MPKKYNYTKTFRFDGKRYIVRADTEEELNTKLEVKEEALKKAKEQRLQTIKERKVVKVFFEKYMETYREPVVADKTVKQERTIFKLYIDDILGAKLFEDVEAIDCQNVLNKMAQQGKTKKYIKKAKLLMQNFFESAINNQYAIFNPADKLKMPTHNVKEDGTHRQISDEERKALLTVCESHKYALWALIMLYCGLRPDETKRVKKEHIDLKNNILYIDGTKTKSSKRKVPIPDVFAKRLKKAKYNEEGYLFYNENRGKSYPNGRPLTDTNRQRMWQQLVKEMHVAMDGKLDYGEHRRIVEPCKVAKDFVPYCLRHTYCTDLQDAGVPINVAKEFMGHNSIEVTAKYYTHLTDTSFENARKQMNKKSSPKKAVKKKAEKS